MYCSSAKTSINQYVIGSFVRIKQLCGNCNRIRVWESQPIVEKTPLGNILTSAAILFSGSLPTKALRMFKILKCSSITEKTYFRHQSSILQPAVSMVWERSQQSMIRDIRRQNRKLILAGDGRADSPGHSAKYGSYSVIDMEANKLLDFKLVQVRNMFQ